MTRFLWMSVLVCVVQCLPMSQNELEDFSNYLLKTSSLDIHVKSADPDASLDEDEVILDHAWENSGKFEGDLILNDRQRRLIVENVEGLSRNGLTDSTKRWPNNEVIYFIQREHFNSGQVQTILAGINDLAQASCVKFRPYRKGDRDAVVIQGSRRGCFSQVGYQGGYQVLNLSGRHPVGRGCFRHGTVVHELLHSLGFYHMQSSPDRDDYIDVIWSNIVQPARHNFRKYNSFSVSDFGVGYDYDSVLHYSRRAFSANGQDTLVPKKNGAQIGQREGLSDKDTQKLNKMYCDVENEPAVQADENNTTKKPKNKKKKPKNLPFEGHGIGYHQGKTVVIKLPAAEIYKLPNVPSTRVFDFSKTSQVVPPEAEGYRFGEEITYTYKPITSLNFDIIKEYNKPKVMSTVNKNTELQLASAEDVKHPKENKDEHSSSHRSNNVKPEYVPIDNYDKDLKDAFDRLTKIVQQHIYPQNKGYNHRTNKDYSKFLKPFQHQHPEHQKFEQAMSYDSSIITPLKQIHVAQTSHDKIRNSHIQDRMDSFFGTSIPTKKPYSSYKQTETTNYATLEYLKNRNNFSNLYSPKNTDDDDAHKDDNISVNRDKYKENIKINPYNQGFHTDVFFANKKNRLYALPENNDREEVKSSKYERKESPKKLQLEGVNISFRTVLPTKKPYSAYEQTETPTYATLKYLKNRHDISNIFPIIKSDHKTKNELYIIPKDDLTPTDGDWSIKDSYKSSSPADYERDAYTDYVPLKHKEHESTYDDTEENKRSLDLSTYNDGENTDYQDNEKRKADINFNNDNSKEQDQSRDNEGHDYDYYSEK